MHRVSRACYVKDSFQDQKSLLSESHVQNIFDIGAHCGETAARYRASFPEATIYSFEPFSEPLAKLKRDFQNDPLVKPIPLAISDKSGRTSFYVNEDSFTNSLLPSFKQEGYRNICTVDVPVTTIDDFCREKAIDEIDILKMDIQGGELKALEGANNKLLQKRISLIYTEVLFDKLYEGQAFFFQVCNFLHAYDYTLFDQYNIAYNENNQLAWGDAIFISPQIAKKIKSE